MKLADVYIDDVPDRLRAAIREVSRQANDSNCQADALQVWWNPRQRRAAMSVGDWALHTSGQWLQAITKVVPAEDIEFDTEWGPSKSDGWVLVKDTKRIADRAGMSPERQKIVFGEGVVAAARGDILNIVNELAGRVAHSVEMIFGDERDLCRLLAIGKPSVAFSEDEDAPAVVTMTIGRISPQAMTVTVNGDGSGEIKFEITEKLSQLLNVPRLASLNSENEVSSRCGMLVAAIKDRMGHRFLGPEHAG